MKTKDTFIYSYLKFFLTILMNVQSVILWDVVGFGRLSSLDHLGLDGEKRFIFPGGGLLFICVLALFAFDFVYVDLCDFEIFALVAKKPRATTINERY
jgi:hypothetical protein